MAVPITLPLSPALDSNANPLAGAMLEVFVTGTTTPATVYQDQGLTTPHANPVIASSDGKFPVMFPSPSVTYRFRVKNAAGALISGYDFDPVSAPATNASVSALQSSIASSGGADAVGYTQGGTGATVTNTATVLRERLSPQQFGAAGDGTTDDTTAVNNAIAAVGTPGTVYLPAGKTYRVTSLTNAKSVGFSGEGNITIGTGNAAYAIRPYNRRKGGPIYGREYLYRFYARINIAGTAMTVFIDGDSTTARGNTTVVGGVSGTTLTVSNAGTASLVPGTYVTSISGSPQIQYQNSGTRFGAGVYTIGASGSIAPGSTINIGNGGGFAGDPGEPQALLKGIWRRNGVRNTLAITNLAIGGSTWQDLTSRTRSQYLDASSDVLIVKAPINRGASVAADIASMRQYFTDIRAAAYGRVDLLSIVLVGYSPAHDTSGGRTSLYAELMHQACLQCVDDFKLCYVDVHDMYADGSWMTNYYLDSAGVHPAGLLQPQIWNKVGKAMIEAGDAQLSTGDGWILLTPGGSYLAYDNGFGQQRCRLNANGDVEVVGGIRPPATTVTANDTLFNCPNQNYYPDTSVTFEAAVFTTGTAWTKIECGVDVAGRCFARETVTNVTAILFRAGTKWPTISQ